MSGPAIPSDLVARLQSARPHARDLAAAYLGDLLEAGALSRGDYNTAVRALIRAAVAEKDPVAKESMFNALSSAAGSGEAADSDWGLIADHLEGLDASCLEHALLALGFSEDVRFRDRIGAYLAHPDEAVRSAAADALQALAGKAGGARAQAREA